MIYSIKKIILLVIANLFLISCANTRYIPTETKIIYNYIDSTIVHRDTISIAIPKEIIKEVVYADSSHLETSVASSTAIVDSCGFLHHSLENKPNTSLKKEIVYQDKIIFRDSIAVKEIPVEVEKIVKKLPQIFWYSIAFNLLFLIILIKKLFF